MDDRDTQALLAAKLYYQSGLSQAEVASKMQLSRPTVVKLLQHARSAGFVRIEVFDPREQQGELSQLLREQFSLIDAHVVHVPPPTQDVLLAELGKAGARLLESLVSDGDLVGVSWGNTMLAVAKALEHQAHAGVEIVQLKGGLSHTQRSANDIETISLFCQAFDAFARTLPLPVIFDNPETKAIVEQDRHIASVLRLGQQADIVVFTVGTATEESLPLTMGYLSDAEMAELSKRAVGDACSRFFDANGEIALPEVDVRTVGISLEDLCSRPTRLMVAGGKEKAEAIRVALEHGFATHLVIDAATAEAVLS